MHYNMVTAKGENNFLDYSVFSKSLEEMVNGISLMVNTINQYSYCLVYDDKMFRKSLRDSDFLLNDVGIAFYAVIFFM